MMRLIIASLIHTHHSELSWKCLFGPTKKNIQLWTALWSSKKNVFANIFRVLKKKREIN